MRLVVHGFQEVDFLRSATDLGVDFATSDTLWPFAFAGTSDVAFAPARADARHAAA
jgi:hypothetical protein